MKRECQDFILQATGAETLHVGAKIQTLWSGYGEIVRVRLTGCERPSVVVKHVKFPRKSAHPGGWNTDLSHLRKVRSYQVEAHWYQHYSTGPDCRVPFCLGAQSFGDEQLLVLEDLDAAGFDQRRTSVNGKEAKACLRWLACFHARFLGTAPDGLWPTGTYWHLETRPDELAAMADGEVKAAAAEIDRALSGCRFKTIVHGDAKLANFCFAEGGRDVAAVDFQYVGGGCGMKDVAYFLGSCLEEDECEVQVPPLLDHYFVSLREAVDGRADIGELEAEWRAMFALAWTDYHRFLLGWMPGHRKIHRYSRKLAQEALRKL